MQMHWAIFSSISCRILQTGEMGNSHLGAFQKRWLLSLNRDGWEGHLRHRMSVTGLSHALPGRRDQTLDKAHQHAQGSSASTVHFVPSGHCKSVGLQAVSSLAFRCCFSVLVLQRSIPANTGHLHSLFVCFYFLKDFFSGYDSIKMNT